MARSGNNSVEAIVIISGVMDSTDGTISFMEGVGALYYITITDFLLGFLVTGVCVSYSVVEFVFGISNIVDSRGCFNNSWCGFQNSRGGVDGRGSICRGGVSTKSNSVSKSNPCPRLSPIGAAKTGAAA